MACIGTNRRVVPLAPLGVPLALVLSLGLALVAVPIDPVGAQNTSPPSASPAQEPSEEQVVEVRVVGCKSIPMQNILTHIKTRAGRPFDPELIEEDVRRLHRSRMFFHVRTFSERTATGRVVIFEVVERPMLDEVKYVGNQAVPRKKLEKESGLKPGQPLDTFEVEEARRRLEEYYHTHGFPSARVTLFEGDKPEDRRAVFVINEGAKQRIAWTQFVGNTIASDARLRTQIRSKPGFLWLFKNGVDRKQIDEDVDRLTAYYRSLGFFRARIGRELSFYPDPFTSTRQWLVLTYVIDEGPRYEVRNVSFVGNTKYSAEELAEKLTLRPGAFFDQAKMKADITQIQDQYGAIGYIFADVKADPRFLEEPGKLDLVYAIEEGRRYRVGKINVQIRGDFPHTRITTVLNRISLQPGDIVNLRELRASERRLRASQLFEVDPTRGVAPKIVFSPPELDDVETAVARQPQRPGGFRGQSPDPAPCAPCSASTSATATRQEDALVDLRVEGQWLPQPAPSPAAFPERAPAPPAPEMTAESVRVVRGQNPQGGLLYRGQYTPDDGRPVPAFNPNPRWSPPPPRAPNGDVQTAQRGVIFPDRPIPGDTTPWLGLPPDDEPPLDIPLEPIVEEARTGRLMFSVGVNSDAGLIGTISVDEQNFDWTRWPRSWADIRDGVAWRGAGQRFRLEAVPGTQVHRYTISFQEPYAFDTQVSLGLSGFYYARSYREWLEERLGGRIALGYQFTPDLSGTIAFRGAKVGLSDPVLPTPIDLADALGDSSLYGFQIALTHDTRDNAFLATEGHLIEFSVEEVVGTYQYPRAEIDLRRYFMLHQRPDGSGRHVLSLAARCAITGDDTPIYEHYFAGGFSSLRGFRFRGASPRDLDVPIGGHFMLLASAEYMFPLTADDLLRLVVFCDTGTVEPRIDQWSDRYRVSLGLGVRITIPAMGPAPIALDFAFPVSEQPGDENEVFSFFIGFLR